MIAELTNDLEGALKHYRQAAKLKPYDEDATAFYSRSAWNVFLPGFAIFLTVLAINLIGDGLRDALDPRLND